MELTFRCKPWEVCSNTLNQKAALTTPSADIPAPGHLKSSRGRLLMLSPSHLMLRTDCFGALKWFNKRISNQQILHRILCTQPWAVHPWCWSPSFINSKRFKVFCFLIFGVLRFFGYIIYTTKLPFQFISSSQGLEASPVSLWESSCLCQTLVVSSRRFEIAKRWTPKAHLDSRWFPALPEYCWQFRVATIK